MAEPTAPVLSAPSASPRQGWVLAGLVLALYFQFPAREAMTPQLDSTNFASYATFTARHLQYGTEVVPMAGPYGFLMYGWVYNGELFWTRYVGQFVLGSALAALTLWFFYQARGGWPRWAWLAVHLAFTPFIEDLPIEWTLLLGGFFLLLASDTGRLADLRTLGASAVLALCSLIKGTHLLLGGVTMAVVLLGLAGSRRWRQLGLVTGGYVGSLLACWLLAGQSPLNLPAFVRGVLELSGGYTEAMALPTPHAVLHRGLCATVFIALALAAALPSARRSAPGLAALALVAGFCFVQWKRSFVRADGHAYIYFHFLPVAALALVLLRPTGTRARLISTIALAVTLVCLVPSREPEPLLPSVDALPAAWSRLKTNLRASFRPAATRAALEAALAAERQTHALPAVRDTVGAATIDGWGYEQGLLFLNNLNYHPRPMGGGSFNVYTPALMALNRDFLRDPARRPAYYLLKPQTIDGRYLPADDGLALVEILQRYKPRLIEHEHLLFETADAVPGGPARLLLRREAHWNERIDVPTVAPDEMLLARFDLRTDTAGKLRAFLYKPGPVTMTLHDSAGNERPRRLATGMARSPFVISPVLEELGDFVAFFTREGETHARHLTLSAVRPADYATAFEIEFFAAPRPPVLGGSDRAELTARLQFPYANRVPDRITPAFRPHYSARFLHAPAEAVWHLVGNERSFVFHYGIDPEAYERGTTNGVDFIVEIRGPSGAVRPVFQRRLTPKDRPEDRGDHTASITLPLYVPGSQLVLRTAPGEHGDNAWDWAYFNRARLDGAATYDASLFPGFTRLPVSAEGENAATIDLEGRKALLLHVPGVLRFALRGDERRVDFDFGFLPGAYSNGGNTTGAAFVIELQSGGGAPRELFRRTLRPVTHSDDRGQFTAGVTLPPLQAGDILVVRTTELAGGTNSWGWTYFSRFTID